MLRSSAGKGGLDILRSVGIEVSRIGAPGKRKKR